jgi:sugar/nucleoside kinase (ribokinase family)
LVAGPDGGLLHGRLYVRGPYPVGSGDAFLGGLVTALDRGDGWRDAIALALGAATANAEMPGAGRLDPVVAAELAARADLSPA